MISYVLASVAGGLSAYELSRFRQLGSIRGSALSSLLFCVLLSFFGLETQTYEVYISVFFGASFVGMTSPFRAERVGVCVASLMFVPIFFYLLPLAEGHGGGLGTSAFLSVAAVLFLKKALGFCQEML